MPDFKKPQYAVTLKPFITSNSRDVRVLFENYGITVYYAQMSEGCLQTVLLAAELQGQVIFDRKEDFRISPGDEEILHACLGPMIKVLRKNKRESDTGKFTQMLTEANEARRLLVHRFFLENSVDLLNDAGRRSINDHLGRLYLKIRQALTVCQELRGALFTEWGVTEDIIAKRRQEFLRDLKTEENNGD